MENKQFVPLECLLLTAEPEPNRVDSDIEEIIFRASPGKAYWQQLLFEGLEIPMRIEASEWDEDAHQGPISVTRSAARKAYDSTIGRENPPLGEGRGVQLHFATDVEYRIENRQVRKPREATSKADIERLLFEEFAQGPREVAVHVGQAIYGRTPSGLGKGITQHEGHKFLVEPLSPAEIELYVYGMAGRLGDNPPYLKTMVTKLEESYQLDKREKDRLRSGMSLDQLKQTVLGCRWPHVLLQSKIMSVNGVDRGEEGFEEELGNLFWALLGAPRSSVDLVSYFSALSLSDTDTPESSLYPEIGHWEQILHLDGRIFSFRRFIPQDAEAVSQMAHDNFSNAETYKTLTPEERELYKQANNPTGVLETSTNPQNVAALTVKELTDGEDKIVGWRVLRRSANPHFIEGKRMHVSRDTRGVGLGKRLLAISEGLAVDAGARALLINASGVSADFFNHQGYQELGAMENHDGVFEGDSLPKPQKTRLIKYL